MTEIPWAQQAVNRFFERCKCPIQLQCEQIAQSVSGASDVHNVDTPGSMSYTVVCTGRHAGKQDLVVSFREPEGRLDQGMGKMAQVFHGYLVPETSHYGMVDGADPPLAIYTMPYLRGISCLDALACQVEMDGVAEAKHFCFVRHLARYGGQHIARLLVWGRRRCRDCSYPLGTLLDVGPSRSIRPRKHEQRFWTEFNANSL